MSRLYVPVVLGMLVAGAIAWYAVTRVWATASTSGAGMPAGSVSVTGRDGAPMLVAVAIVIVTAALAVVASGGWLRQLIGLVVAALALYSAAWAQSLDVGNAPMTKAVHASPVFMGARPDLVTYSQWQLVATVSFLGAAVLALAVAAFSRSWPHMGRRYERPVADEPAAGRMEQGDMWKAFDEGRDPTERPSSTE